MLIPHHPPVCRRYVAKRSIRSEIRRSKKQLAVLHVTEDLPVRKALHFKVGFMNPECRRIVEAMGGTVELVPRWVRAARKGLSAKFLRPRACST